MLSTVNEIKRHFDPYGAIQREWPSHDPGRQVGGSLSDLLALYSNGMGAYVTLNTGQDPGCFGDGILARRHEGTKEFLFTHVGYSSADARTD